MVICYPYFYCRAVGAIKANAPLVINADAILSGAVAFELLQPVPRYSLQILQRIGIVQVEQFAPRRTLDFRGKFSGELTPENPFGFLGRKEFDHYSIKSSGDNIVKRRESKQSGLTVCVSGRWGGPGT